MKKLTLIISALALVLGMSQCRKPNVQSYAGIARDITFNAVGDGSKGYFYQDGDMLKLKWQVGDRLFVYASNNSESFDETTGSYLGTLNIVEGMGEENATFKGTLEFTEQMGYLRFVHVGQKISVNNNGEASCSYTTQNGVIAENNDNIARVTMAHIDLPITGSEYTGILKPEYAVIEFDLAFLKGKTATLKGGYTNDKLTLNANGSFTASKTETEAIALNDITDAPYYLIVLPETTAQTYVFYDGTTEYQKSATKAVEAGVFYSNSGSPIHVIDVDVLPGKFSVSATKKVQFSKGNLQYQASTNTWRFAENQWNIVGDDLSQATTQHPNPGPVGNVGDSKNRLIASDYAGWIDLFGFGCTGTKDSRSWNTTQNRYQPYNYDMSGSDWFYGPKYNSEDSYLSVENGSDWGSVAPGNGWYTLTGENSSDGEWYYLFNVRETNFTMEDSESKGVVNNVRFATAKVNGIGGMLLFPDVFTWPAAVEEKPTASANKVTFDSKWSAGTVNYNLSDFALLEAAGVVFLPAAGYRGDIQVGYPSMFGYYWTKTVSNSNPTHGSGYHFQFSDRGLIIEPFLGSQGYAVRVVCDAIE